MDFLQKLWHGSQISIYMSRVKIAEEIVLLFFFSEFSRNLSEKFFWLLVKKFQEVVKTTFCVCRRTIFGLNFFFKFWIFLDFLQKILAWFSKFYLRVQSKTCGRKSFLIFLFRIFFRILGEKVFRLLAKILKKLSQLTSACPD